jgi:hypothetical protein
MSTDPDRARTLRRRHMRERQAVIFGLLLAGLALTGLASAAVYTGALNVPLLARGFSTPAPSAGVVPPPCPPDGTTPVPYAQVKVNVLNGSARPGLAALTANDLRSRGFGIGTTGNSPAPIEGDARITFGTAGVAAAYTLAAHIDGAKLVLDTRADPSVDLTIGKAYLGLIAADQVTLDPAVPFAKPLGCVPLNKVTPVPGPSGSATATAPDADPTPDASDSATPAG